ncbi:MAG: hypothetical protein Q4D04_06385, partial [Clostridia bacterium]|nr:hypothetical protein [Clostridia bacterium]
DEYWHIDISDNGKGFDEDVLKRLKDMISSDAAPLCENGLSIGGMGIVNTYLRLRAFYGDSLKISLDNAYPGTIIRLSARRHNHAHNDS